MSIKCPKQVLSFLRLHHVPPMKTNDQFGGHYLSTLYTVPIRRPLLDLAISLWPVCVCPSVSVMQASSLSPKSFVMCSIPNGVQVSNWRVDLLWFDLISM